MHRLFVRLDLRIFFICKQRDAVEVASVVIKFFISCDVSKGCGNQYFKQASGVAANQAVIIAFRCNFSALFGDVLFQCFLQLLEKRMGRCQFQTGFKCG